LKLITILPIQEKKKKDYNNTVIEIDKTVDKAQQAQFHLYSDDEGQVCLSMCQTIITANPEDRSLNRQHSNPVYYREAKFLHANPYLKVIIYTQLVGPPYFVCSQDFVYLQ